MCACSLAGIQRDLALKEALLGLQHEATCVCYMCMHSVGREISVRKVVLNFFVHQAIHENVTHNLSTKISQQHFNVVADVISVCIFTATKSIGKCAMRRGVHTAY